MESNENSGNSKKKEENSSKTKSTAENSEIDLNKNLKNEIQDEIKQDSKTVAAKNEDDIKEISPRFTVEVLKDELRLQIAFLLQIFGELSLSELTEKLPKSKPTIHRHLQKLIEYDIVQESKEEFVRGNIPAKYYSIKGNLLEKIPIISPMILSHLDENEKNELYTSPDTISTLKSSITFSKLALNIFENYVDNLDISTPETLRELFEENEIGMVFTFISKEAKKILDEMIKIQPGSKEYNNKQTEFRNIIQNPQDEQEFFQFSCFLPLKKIIENFSKSEEKKS